MTFFDYCKVQKLISLAFFLSVTRKMYVNSVFKDIPKFQDPWRKGWTLDPRRCTLDTGLWKLDSERWTLDAQCYTMDVKTLKFKTVQIFGNNGAIPIMCILLRLKSWSARGASHHSVFMGNGLFSVAYPVDEFSFKDMRTWDRFKIKSYCIGVWFESGE